MSTVSRRSILGFLSGGTTSRPGNRPGCFWRIARNSKAPTFCQSRSIASYFSNNNRPPPFWNELPRRDFSPSKVFRDNLRHKSVSFVFWKVCERFVRLSGFIGSIRFENPVDERYYSPRDTKRAHSTHKLSMTQRSRRFATTGIFIVSLRKGIYHGKSTRAWTRAAL